VLTRSRNKVRDYPWAADVEVAEGDAADPEAVRRACAGIDVVYYLIHAIGSGSDFEDTDRRTARAVATARPAPPTGEEYTIATTMRLLSRDRASS
jgi:uncharacterized protein YbjT (DUF2867 family)